MRDDLVQEREEVCLVGGKQSMDDVRHFTQDVDIVIVFICQLFLNYLSNKHILVQREKKEESLHPLFSFLAHFI